MRKVRRYLVSMVQCCQVGLWRRGVTAPYCVSVYSSQRADQTGLVAAALRALPLQSSPASDLIWAAWVALVYWCSVAGSGQRTVTVSCSLVTTLYHYRTDQNTGTQDIMLQLGLALVIQHNLTLDPHIAQYLFS